MTSASQFHTSVISYEDEEYKRSLGGNAGYLPKEFDDRLSQWILSIRALKFPIFKDTIIGAANDALHGMACLDKFKHGALGNDDFLSSHSHLFDTANHQPQEISREQWATAHTTQARGTSCSRLLLWTKRGVAVENAENDDDAPPDSHEAQRVSVVKPNNLISFDESRVELDTNQSSKSNSECIVVDKHASLEIRRETITHKGGLAGTTVCGSTASRRVLCAANHHLYCDVVQLCIVPALPSG